MAEYIERAALLKKLKGSGAICDFGEHLIEQFPTADVAPVVHGRWLKRRNGGTLCSRCGHYTQYKGQVLDMSETVACPWCRAMMDGDGDA